MSALLDKAERLFFDDLPGVLRWGAILAFVLGIFGPLALVLSNAGENYHRLGWSALRFWVPGVLLLTLSVTIPRRMVISVPLILLVLALCVFSLRGVPGAA